MAAPFESILKLCQGYFEGHAPQISANSFAIANVTKQKMSSLYLFFDPQLVQDLNPKFWIPLGFEEIIAEVGAG